MFTPVVKTLFSAVILVSFDAHLRVSDSAVILAIAAMAFRRRIMDRIGIEVTSHIDHRFRHRGLNVYASERILTTDC
jgi:hypothetical protein